MAADFTEFVANLKPAFTGETWQGLTTFRADPTALQKTALEVVQNLFPDYVKAGAAKVSKDPLYSGPRGTYSWSPFATVPEEIKLANPQVSSTYATSYEPTAKGRAAGKKSSTQIEFSTKEVMDYAGTILHELYHDRSKAGFRGDRQMAMQSSGVTQQDLDKANKLAQPSDAFDPAALYSMRKDGLDVEEFMASAVSLLDMKSRGAIVQNSRQEAMLGTIEKIMQEIPSMAKFIESQRTPEIKSLSAPPEGTLGSILQSLFGGPSQVMETAGGVTPGTPRLKGK